MIIEIDNIKIGENQPPYIIAEISANHNGDIKNAIKLIDMAKDCGASAVKLQSYTPDTITLDSNNDDFIIEGGLWDGRRLYDLYAEAFLPWEWHKPLFDHARNKDITIFSSVFDNSSVDFLEDLNTPAYKIASFEAIDLPLIKYTASTGKPMIISTGLADKEEIESARKDLIRTIDVFAKDISTKYIAPPNTTDFGIMFLPIEGLFAEVLREPGIMERLRQKYKIALTGPTTLSALLNSLQMGFRTLLVQERSSEVWNILSAVKSEFATFGNQLTKVRSQLKTASSSLDNLQGTRTRAMERKLRDVELIETEKSNEILELPNEES